METKPPPGANSMFYASERKRADPLGWPFGSLPPDVIERELRKRAMAEELKGLASAPARRLLPCVGPGGRAHGKHWWSDHKPARCIQCGRTKAQAREGSGAIYREVRLADIRSQST